MTNILAIGDIHAKASNVTEVRELRDKVMKFCETKTIDFIVILGDLNDTFEKIHVQAFNEAINLIDVLSQKYVVFYIVGNHDFINNQVFMNDDHSFNAFKHWDRKNLRIVDQTMTCVNDGNLFVFCPYVPNGRFVEALNATDWKEARVIFCHQEFKGAQMGAYESKHGDTWELSNPFVVSGHIHDRNFLQPNILYTGAPLYDSFAESANKTISLIQVGENITEEPINLDLPRKITIRTDIKGFGEAAISAGESESIRVILSCTEEEWVVFKKSDEYKKLPNTVKIVPKITNSVRIKKNIAGKEYIELLKESMVKEPEPVKTALEEILK